MDNCIIFASHNGQVTFAFHQTKNDEDDYPLGVDYEDSYSQYEMVHHKVSLVEAERLLDLICSQQTKREEIPDDFTADIWIGKKLIRYGGMRLYIDLSELHDQLYEAIKSVNVNQNRESKWKEDLESILSGLVANLDL